MRVKFAVKLTVDLEYFFRVRCFFVFLYFWDDFVQRSLDCIGVYGGLAGY